MTPSDMRFLACLSRLRDLAPHGQHYARLAALTIGWASR